MIRKNAVGVDFTSTVQYLGVAVDISSATLLQMRFKKPDGTTVSKVATFVTDGIDGRMHYVSLVGDLNVTGLWEVQAYVEMPSGRYPADPSVFVVGKNVEAP